ncbi:Uncharacterised protein [Mycobacteroides abscessus subsp. abscessus]|nr:Uncharacterised protein [Mycobacteroides abscessus subsp. abscessus]
MNPSRQMPRDSMPSSSNSSSPGHASLYGASMPPATQDGPLAPSS